MDIYRKLKYAVHSSGYTYRVIKGNNQFVCDTKSVVVASRIVRLLNLVSGRGR